MDPKQNLPSNQGNVNALPTSGDAPQTDQNSPVTPITPPVEESIPVSSPPTPISVPEVITSEQPININVPQTSEPEAQQQTPNPEQAAQSIIGDSEPKKKKGKLIAAIAGVVLLLVSIPLGIFLINQNQEIRNKAAGSDPNHCGNSEAKRAENGQTVGTCSGWQKDNKSCEGDAVNFYYYDSCAVTAPQAPTASHPDGCGRSDDTVQCLDDNQKKESRNVGFNAVCYTKAGAPAESIKVSDSRCGAVYTTPPTGGTHPDGCARVDDTVQCLDDNQKKEERNIGKNAVCYTKDSKPAESILVQNNRCGAPYQPAGTNQLTNVSLNPTSVASGQSVTFTASFSGPTAAKVHVRIWPNDAPGVTAVDGGKITSSGGNVSYDTSKLPAGTKTARVRFQLQDASDKDIGGIAQDLNLTITTPASSLQVTSASVSPNPASLGQTLTFTAALSAAGKIHVRIWPNDAPGVTAIDGGKLTPVSGGTPGQLNSITYDTSKLPANTTSAKVRFQAQTLDDKDVAGVAKDIDVKFQTLVGDARCTQIELLRGNSIIFTSDTGNVAPEINVGDKLTFKVYCFTDDPNDSYDKIRYTLTTPSAAAETKDLTATRIQSRDQGGKRFYTISVDYTVATTGAYNLKAWAHSATKDSWKGK